MEAATSAAAELPLADRPTDLMGIRACATALVPKVSPSTITRQLAKGLFKNWGTEDRPQVSLAEVKTARAEKLNPAQQRAPATRSGGKQPDSYHSARAEREQAAAKIAQLDLAARLGQVVLVDAVEDAQADIGRQIREGLYQTARKVIPELDEISGTEAKIAHLTAAIEERLTAFADAFEAKGDGSGSKNPS